MPPKGRKEFEKKLNTFFFFFSLYSQEYEQGWDARGVSGAWGEPLTPADTSLETRNVLPSALKTHAPAFTPLCLGPWVGLQ